MKRGRPRRRTFVSISWLDVKLGLRMLAKYPGLSIVAVLGMSLAITIGAGYFAFIGAMMDSTLPIEEGDRVVVIQNRVVAGPDAGDTNRASERLAPPPLRDRSSLPTRSLPWPARAGSHRGRSS